MTQAATARVPSVAKLQDAAIAVSKLLRDAKVDAPLRPKVLASLLLAAAHGGLHRGRKCGRAEVNQQVAEALRTTRVTAVLQRKLLGVVRLSGADFARLNPFLPAIADVLASIDIGHALHSDFDFLGLFYEAFLRYGYDNNALGIVFTPRHITRFCVDLAGVSPHERVIDIACGTGGFLVPAYERMAQTANSNCTSKMAAAPEVQGGPAVYGFDTNPTVWALAFLNLLFRAAVPRFQSGSHWHLAIRQQIELGSCFEALHRPDIRRRFTRAFLNPPFSQGAEPERNFVDAAMETLAAGGLCAAVVKAGIFADEEHASWRAEFLRRHTLLAVISLPEDLFYPAAAPTSILLASAHLPQPGDASVLMARVFNDGYEKLKNKRVERSGCELPEVERCFQAMLAGARVVSPLALTVTGTQLDRGGEWSPQEWLPQPNAPVEKIQREQVAIVTSIFRAAAEFPELAASTLDNFGEGWTNLPPLPLELKAPLNEFFVVLNGKSAGEKHYADGPIPYVSSSGDCNSIVRLIDGDEAEVFSQGAITVTAFGHASLQPWPFLARGNGGSSVRVLVPRYRMAVPQLLWFAAQINAQKWRFFYARMAIKSRIERLMVCSPPKELHQPEQSLAAKVRGFRRNLEELSRVET